MNNKKNIILLMTDQHRMDYVSFAGSKKISTPNIDRIAESVGFTCCQTVNPICTPARTALATGKYTHQIGTLAMSGDLSRQFPTYMQALQKAGYHTSGIGKFHYLQTWEWNTKRGRGVNLTGIREDMKKYGFDYIWETSGKQLSRQNYCDYCEYMDKKGLLDKMRDFVDMAGIHNSDYPDDEGEGEALPWPFAEEDYVDILTADKIIESIGNRPETRPFFIFGSFCSPHKPFDPPKRYLDMIPYEEEDDFIPGPKALTDPQKKKIYRRRRAYKAMIKLVDHQVGRIFDRLEKDRLLEDTVVIFTSDHGEMLGDHFRVQKSIYWKEAVTVPTAIRHPDYTDRRLINTPVEITDLAATILDIAGLDPSQSLSKEWPAFNDIVPSRSLMPIVRGETGKIRDFAFSECDGKWQMLRTEKWKYVRHLKYTSPQDLKEEFYDLETGPDEMVNLIAHPAYAEAIDWCRKRREFVTDTTPPAQTSWAPLMGSEK